MSDGVILAAVFFSILADIPSLPLVFVVSSITSLSHLLRTLLLQKVRLKHGFMCVTRTLKHGRSLFFVIYMYIGTWIHTTSSRVTAHYLNKQYKYKKQFKNCKVSRDGDTKKYTNKSI